MIKTSFERMIENKNRVKAWKGLIDQICQIDKVKCNSCKQLTHAYYKNGGAYCSSCRKRIPLHTEVQFEKTAELSYPILVQVNMNKFNKRLNAMSKKG